MIKQKIFANESVVRAWNIRLTHGYLHFLMRIPVLGITTFVWNILFAQRFMQQCLDDGKFPSLVILAEVLHKMRRGKNTPINHVVIPDTGVPTKT